MRTTRKQIAARLAKELAETRALQPRLKREMYERQAQRRSGPTKAEPLQTTKPLPAN